MRDKIADIGVWIVISSCTRRGMRDKIADIGVWIINMVGRLAYFFIMALPVMFLWNSLEIFPTINYGKAFGLIVLANILTQPFTPLEKNAKTLD